MKRKVQMEAQMAASRRKGFDGLKAIRWMLFDEPGQAPINLVNF